MSRLRRLPALGTGDLALLAGGLALAAAILAVPRLSALWLQLLPLAAVGLPALALAGLLAWRRPGLAVGLLGLVAVSWGTVLAQTGSNLQPFADLLVAGLVAAALFGRLTRATPAPLAVPALLLLGGYLLWSATAILTAPAVDLGTDAFRRQMLPLAVVPALALGHWPSQTRERMVRALLLVAALAAAYAVLRYLIGPSEAERQLASGSAQRVADDADALVASFSNRQQLAGWTAVVLPWLLAVGLAARGRWRWVAAAAAAGTVLALFGSQTRVALVAAIVGLVVTGGLLLASRSSRSRVALVATAMATLCALALAGYGLTVGGSEQASKRYANVLTPSEDVTLDQRRQKWEETLREIGPHPLGRGLGTAGSVERERGRFVSSDTNFIDNSYLQLAYQQGVVVTIALVVGLLALLVALGRAGFAAADPQVAAVRVGAAGALASWLVLLSAGDYLERWCTLLCMLLCGVALIATHRPGAQRRVGTVSSAS